MGRFIDIDPELKRFSESLGAKLSIDRQKGAKAEFEERRIDWVEGEIRKAIIIQPTFLMGEVNQGIWNFINIAWYDDPHSVHRLRWKKTLISRQAFEQIESRIVDLLSESEHNLSPISLEDLK